MFCCPYPRDSRIEPVRVPFIARTKYSVKAKANFDEFFKTAIGSELQHFLSKDGLKENASPNATFAQGIASAIQSWLFFGLASEAVGTDIKQELFVRRPREDPSQSYIDARIPEWYYDALKTVWKQLDKSLPTNQLDAVKDKIKKKWQSAKLAVVTMDVICLGLDDENDTIAKVLLSVHNLLYVTAHVLDRGNVTITQTNPALSLTTKFLMRRMVSNGWCAKRLNLFDAEPLFYPAMYYLSSLTPPRILEQDHSKCSSQVCQVPSGLVAPLHRTSECLCEDIAVPIEHVNNIVAKGGIPLVRVTWSPMGKMTLEVVPYIPGTRYIAISHVWGDRQFGSASNALPKCQLKYLEEVISTIPTDMDQWGLRGWLTNWTKTTPLTGEIEPPSRTYEYFWLDSFCIPQAPEDADLRSKAIESMNLIYAAASHTIVFDKALQALDGGRRPGSLAHGGRPTYYAPSDEHLLDVVGSIYASTWMGRAWTLQEGVLSGHIIFPLKGSFAYLKTLWPHWNDGDMSWGVWRDMVIGWIPEALKKEWRHSFPEKHKTKMKAKFDKRERGDDEPLREYVRSQIYEHMKQTLQVEQYRNYARTPADRAARFVKAHHALQSRTTTQAEDIPLILMNMSCLNANVISQEKTIEKRMKQLIYSLESLPAELLFSDCARLGSCEVDAWIPREIAKEKFAGEHTLKLGSLGFTFETQKGKEPLQFFLLSSATRAENFRLALPDRKDGKPCIRRFDARVQHHVQEQNISASTSMWCIVVSRSLLEDERAARFLIDRVIGDKYFLHFDCSLALKEVRTADKDADDEDSDNEAQKKAEMPVIPHKVEIGAVLLTGQFILHRSHDSQDLSISRPQNPEQYSDRLIVIGQAITGLLSLLERHTLRYFFGDENSLSAYFYILYGIYSWKKRAWVEKALNAFVHKAWMATYQPDWDPNGPWKWFWRLSNWEPPVPFKTMMRFYCKIMFGLCFQFGAWSGVAMITLYWLPLFDREELLGMYMIGLIGKVVFRFIF